jgi:hypothetical protein
MRQRRKNEAARPAGRRRRCLAWFSAACSLGFGGLGSAFGEGNGGLVWSDAVPVSNRPLKSFLYMQ